MVSLEADGRWYCLAVLAGGAVRVCGLGLGVGVVDLDELVEALLGVGTLAGGGEDVVGCRIGVRRPRGRRRL